jgi:hypothetical protein
MSFAHVLFDGFDLKYADTADLRGIPYSDFILHYYLLTCLLWVGAYFLWVAFRLHRAGHCAAWALLRAHQVWMHHPLRLCRLQRCVCVCVCVCVCAQHTKQHAHTHKHTLTHTLPRARARALSLSLSLVCVCARSLSLTLSLSLSLARALSLSHAHNVGVDGILGVGMPDAVSILSKKVIHTVRFPPSIDILGHGLLRF